MKKMIGVFVLLFLCTPHFISSLQAQDSTIELAQQLQKIADSAQGEIAGFSVAIIDAKRVHFQQGFGYADIEKQTRFTERTVMNIGSISKTTIGVSLMIGVEQGLFKLDDPINEHLPFNVENPHSSNDVITIRHLATHTSGIHDRTIPYDMKAYRYSKNTPRDPKVSLKRYLQEYLVPKGKLYNKKNFLKAKTGSTYHYTNIGAALAAFVVESAAGMTYAEFTKKHIFDPLGMQHTTWHFAETDMSLHAKLYKKSLKPFRYYSLATYPDGGLRTNAAELAMFFRMIKNGGVLGETRILATQSIQEMLRAQFDTKALPDKFDMVNQGLFWAHEILSKKTGLVLDGHSGGDPGVVTFMFWDKEKEVGKILLINTEITKKSMPILKQIWQTLSNYEQAISVASNHE